MSNLGANASVGSTIDFHVLRDGKVIHEHKKLHNFMLYDMLYSTSRLNLLWQYDMLIRTYDRNTWVKLPTDSTYTQNGTSLTRTSGTFDLRLTDLTDAIFVWQGPIIGGTWVSSVSESSIVMSRSLSVPDGTPLVAIGTKHHFTVPGFSDRLKQTSTSVPTFAYLPTYSNGVLTKATSGEVALPKVTSPYTLKCITLGENKYSYDLPTPIDLIVGDQLVVTNVSITLTYADYQPKTFAANYIVGINSSGRYQKLLNANHEFATNYIDTGTTSNKLYLVATPNAIPLVDLTAPSSSTPYGKAISSINPAQILTATSAVFTAPSDANLNVTSALITATVGTTITNVKQIYYGTTGRNELYSVIDFDNEVTLTQNQTLTFKSTVKITPDLPLNNMFA